MFQIYGVQITDQKIETRLLYLCSHRQNSPISFCCYTLGSAKLLNSPVVVFFENIFPQQKVQEKGVKGSRKL